MQIYEADDPRPFQAELYRTDDALFIHVLLRSPEMPRRQMRLLSKTMFYSLGFFLFIAFVRNDIEAIFAFAVLFTVAYVVATLFFRLVARNQSLVRIDKTTIRRTSWSGNQGSRETHLSIKRPENISFFKLERHWFLTAKGKKTGRISFRVRDDDFCRIQDAIGQFEKEVPYEQPDDEQSAMNRDDTSAKKILENMEFQGQKLRRIPRPGEESLEDLKTEHVLPGTLQVLCGRCCAAIPFEHVLADEAKAHCPACDFLFEIANLKRHVAPKRTTFKIHREEDALYVHQRPRLINVPFFLLVILLYFDLILGVVYLHIQSLNPGTTLQELGFLGPDAPYLDITKILVVFHLFCGLLYLWQIFVHRYVVFHRDEIRFRIRWLCFACSWTVARSRLESPRLSFFVQFWRGFLIPYGKKSFYLGANLEETPWVVGEINHWLFTHPPLEFHLDNQSLHCERSSFDETGSFPTIGGVVENEKEVRWYCGDCGHVFTAAEMNFPKQIAVCPDCEKTYNIKDARYFYVEKMTTVPEDPLLSVENTKEYHLIAVGRPVLTPLQRIGGIAGLFLFTLVIVGCVIGLCAAFIFKDAENQPAPGLPLLPGLLLLVLPLVFYIPLILGQLLLVFSKILDEHRQKFASWSTLFSNGVFVLTRSYKNHTETIPLEWSRIVRFQSCDEFQIDMKAFLNRYPSNIESCGLFRNELLLDDNSTLRLPCCSRRNGDNAWLVNEWNQSLVESLQRHHQ